MTAHFSLGVLGSANSFFPFSSLQREEEQLMGGGIGASRCLKALVKFKGVDVRIGTRENLEALAKLF